MAEGSLGGSEAASGPGGVPAFVAEHAHRRPRPLAVVIAAYNEEEGIGEVVAAVPASVCGLETEVIVVVDGSDDRTAAVAREAGALVCDMAVNRGQGAALRLGYRLARGRGARFIATLDGDGQYHPDELALVVGPVVAGEADLVSGSRRLGTAHTT
ncbi:MAG TPA: glycosyltransferase family 2 protein, partial [Acidimicrobiales bacterium]